MKKIIWVAIVILVSMTALSAKDDPFATKRFTNGDTEISFRFQDEKGTPLVEMKDKENVNRYYYDFDSDYLVFFDSDGSISECYKYLFIKDTSAIRLLDDDGSFMDLDSDNGKSTVDIISEAADSVLGTTVMYALTGAVIGALVPACGPTIGGVVGGVVGAGKALLIDIFHLF